MYNPYILKYVLNNTFKVKNKTKKTLTYL